MDYAPQKWSIGAPFRLLDANSQCCAGGDSYYYDNVSNTALDLTYTNEYYF